MKLTKEDKDLITKAKELVNVRKVTGGVVGEVGCSLLTKKGKIFTGVCMDLACGIGFCAEHTAIANMISHSNETEISSIVACTNSKKNPILYPCGRCRELMQLINMKNRENTFVITSENKKVKLKELLPSAWNGSVKK
jgi:cytidine deaminase